MKRFTDTDQMKLKRCFLKNYTLAGAKIIYQITGNQKESVELYHKLKNEFRINEGNGYVAPN